MKRILVPTDFSPTAEKAFSFAVDIATKTKGTVILYHVYTPVESTFIDSPETRKQYNLKPEATIVKRLQRLKEKVSENASGIAVSTVVGRSPLVNNMLDFADQNMIDLIVMGTQGASGLKKAIIGSVAARIIEKSRLPVLLVPAKYKLQTPGEFVFATNYQKADKQALELVNNLATLFKANVTVLHFLNTNNSALEKEKDKTDFETYAFSMQRIFNKSGIKFHLLETGSIIEAMENLDKKFPYDIMTMVRRKKNFLEKFFIKSFTENMAFLTNNRLLIVPELPV